MNYSFKATAIFSGSFTRATILAIQSTRNSGTQNSGYQSQVRFSRVGGFQLTLFILWFNMKPLPELIYPIFPCWLCVSTLRGFVT